MKQGFPSSSRLGIGSCGRELCSTWLTDFRSVNTSAARYQQFLYPQN
jgi:cell fate regulator YaaT (PSP1 superfamily)